jgi:acyl-CoA synthetase (AMP-forming)/AMP-acid ligase II
VTGTAGRQTLRSLIRLRGAEDGDRTFLEDARSDRLISFAELESRTRMWASILLNAHIARGESVLLDIADPLEFASAYLGVVANGWCAVPLDPATPDGEFSRATRALSPALVIGDRGERTGNGHIVYLDVTALATATAVIDQDGEPSAVGSIRLRTSGSTGEPKIVELTEPQLLHVATAIARHNELAPADRGYNPLPLFHINAEVVALLASLVAGSTLVLDRGFHRSDFWQLVTDRSITWINAVPAILAILARGDLPARPPQLRMIRSASASLPTAVRERLIDAVGDIVIESYGMTEAASQITATSLDEVPPSGSAGRPVGVELQIRVSDGTPAATGEIGAIWIRGAGVIHSYVAQRSPERFDAEGWLETGDLGSQDAAGYLYLAGRSDDVINRGGELVYPREIEEVLMSDPRVLDAIVVARPDEILGSVPAGYVIPRESPATQAEQDELVADLEQLCTEHLSRFKRPALVMLVDDLPRAATGKIRRHEVRKAAQDDSIVSAVCPA